MCGIAGYTGDPDPQLLNKLQIELRHRGPDGHGSLREPGVSLLNTRLAIIDLPGGAQPIYNEDRTCAIVFNGEIYNYRELRAELTTRHRFSTESDTEVILHLYEEKGDDVSRFLKGDFAFCIWDGRRQACLLSRDHLGVKPLYYAITKSGELIFASELKALLNHPDAPTDIDPAAISDYFSYLYIREPRTLIKNIQRLKPGESLLWQKGSVRKWVYWQAPAVDPTLSHGGDIAGKALSLMRQAVRRRLIADVPVGAFLSGGLDSSLIAALASEQAHKLQTFTVGFGEPDFDEMEHAREFANVLGTDHHEFVVNPNARDLIHDVIAAMDEPIGDSSAVPTFVVARECRRFVKVAMSGVGGDEVFFGYPRYLGAKLSQYVPSMLAPLALRLTGSTSSEPAVRDIRGWIRRFGRGLSLPPFERYQSWISVADASGPSLLRPGFASSDGRAEVLHDLARESGGYLDRISRFDIQNYLGSNLLKFCDSMTMAHGLEVRVPFCDVDLVEGMARYPARVRFPGYRLKEVLRSASRNILPRQVLRRKKRGFMIPVGRWFRSELRDFVQDECRIGRLPEFLDGHAVEKCVTEHVTGKANHTNVVWAVLVLSVWLRQIRQRTV